VLVRSFATGLALVLLGCRPTTTNPPTPAPAAAPRDPAIAAMATHTQVAPQVVPPAARPAPTPPWVAEDLPRILAVQPLIRDAAAELGVDASLVNAIIWHESRFNARAKGPGGAAGLMQLMPTTSKSLAKRLGRAHKPYDPEFNVYVGAYLFSRLLKIFDGDQDLALAGYALGHVAVRKRVAAGEPLPERTQRFIAKVHGYAAAFASAPELAAPRSATAHRAPSGGRSTLARGR
jgi:soluble lytic murein transglycosylase-like protein